jgi:hypothetical protein
MAKSDLDIGGSQAVSVLSLDDTPGQAVKATPGLLCGWALLNTAAAITYVQVFDLAAVGSVTLGTTAPNFVIPMAVSTAYHFAFPQGKSLPFANGIVMFATTTPTGSTGATVNGVVFIA